MPQKRFRTRRLWSNTILWSLVSTGLLLVSVVFMAMMHNYWIGAGALAVVIAGLIVAWSHDRADETTYLLDEEYLTLRRKGLEERSSLLEVLDASLLDRVAARDYLSQRLRSLHDAGRIGSEMKETRRAFMRFCTVDIGLRTLSFGIGRRMIDRMPRAKDDLVLLRMRDGRERLLSPIYNQDLVDNIGRLLQGKPRPAIRHHKHIR